MKGYHFVLAVLSCGLLSVFCLRPPALPGWDTDVVVPAYRGTFRLASYLSPDYFQVGDDSAVRFAREFELSPVLPGENIELAGSAGATGILLPDFLFVRPGGGSIGLMLEDLIGMPVPDSGHKAPVPAFVRSLVRNCQLDRIATAEVTAGFADIEVSNHTALAYDSVIVTSSFGVVRLYDVEPGTTCWHRTDIAGASVLSPLEVMVMVSSAGTGPDSVELQKHDSLVVTVALDSIRLSSARLRIPPGRAEWTCPVALGNRLAFRIDSIRLATGLCSLTVTNQFDVAVNARIDMPAVGYSRETRLGPHAVETVCLDLAGLAIDNNGGGDLLLEMLLQAEPETTGGYVTIRACDRFDIDWRTRRINSEMIAGRFLEPVYVASGLDTLLSIPLGVSGVRLSGAAVALAVESEVGFPIELLLRARALRDGREVAALERQLVVPAGTPVMAAQAELDVPLDELLNSGPDLVLLARTVRIAGAGCCRLGARVSGRAMASTPLRFAFRADTVGTPSREFGLTESQRVLRERVLVGAGAEVRVASRLPVSVAGRLILKPAPGATRAEATLVDSVIVGFGAPVGYCDVQGRCVGARDSTFAVELDSSDLSLFNTWPLSARLEIELPDSDTVTVLASDHLAVDALVKLRLRCRE